MQQQQQDRQRQQLNIARTQLLYLNKNLILHEHKFENNTCDSTSNLNNTTETRYNDYMNL